MLTREAFNALLKTLEEPPPHVMFLFATTEPHKVLETIRSRCQLVTLVADQGGGHRRAAGRDPGARGHRARARRGRGAGALGARQHARRALAHRSIAGPGGGAARGRRRAPPLRPRPRPTWSRRSAPACAPATRARSWRPSRASRAARPSSPGRCSSTCGTRSSRCSRRPRPSSTPPTRPAARRSRAFARDLGPDRLQVWLQELLAARERMALLPEHARVVLEVDAARPGPRGRRPPARASSPCASRPSSSASERRPRPARRAPRCVLKPAAPAPAPPRPRLPPRPPPAKSRSGSGPATQRLSAGGALEQRTPPAAAPKGDDAFTRQVADLFTGRIEIMSGPFGELGSLLKQAQQMQRDLDRAREELRRAHGRGQRRRRRRARGRDRRPQGDQGRDLRPRPWPRATRRCSRT